MFYVQPFSLTTPAVQKSMLQRRGNPIWYHSDWSIAKKTALTWTIEQTEEELQCSISKMKDNLDAKTYYWIKLYICIIERALPYHLPKYYWPIDWGEILLANIVQEDIYHHLKASHKGSSQSAELKSFTFPQNENNNWLF